MAPVVLSFSKAVVLAESCELTVPFWLVSPGSTSIWKLNCEPASPLAPDGNVLLEFVQAPAMPAPLASVTAGPKAVPVEAIEMM